jgi:regulatory protein
MDECKPKREQKPKPPRKITPERLANIALHHLDRYASSSENLRQVLQRRVFKAARFHEDMDVDQAKEWIDALIARYVDSGLLNDFAYAEVRARSLLDRGSSQRLIRMKLMEKGLNEACIVAALNALQDDAPDPELFAAIKLARRRRFGPWCDPGKRMELHDKHLAALARSGFSYDLAKRIVDADSVDALEELLNNPRECP